MGKKAKPTTQTTQTTNSSQPPGWLESAYQRNIFTAQNLGQQSFVPYSGNMVAGLTPAHQQSFDAFQNAQGIWQPAVDQAQQGGQSAMGFQPQMVGPNAATAAQTAGQDLAPYMNPFTQAVIEASMGELGRQNQLLQQGNNAAATQAGAFGGSRHGVLGAETNRNFLDVAGRTAAGLNMENFNQALGAAQQDTGLRQQTALSNQDAALRSELANQSAGLQGAGLNLQGANFLAGLGGQMQQQSFADAAALGGIGDMQRGVEQAQLSSAYDEFLRQQQDPYARLQAQIAATAGVPAGAMATQTGTSTGQVQSGQKDYGALGLIPSVLGLFGLSDRRTKENIRKVGATNDNLPIYTFRYKGQPETHMGVMADEVEKKRPGAVVRIGGLGLVNYARV